MNQALQELYEQERVTAEKEKTLMNKLVQAELSEIRRLGELGKSKNITPKVVTFLHTNPYIHDDPTPGDRVCYILLSDQGIVALDACDSYDESESFYKQLKEAKTEEEKSTLVLGRFNEGKSKPFKESLLYDAQKTGSETLLMRASTIRKAIETIVKE